MLHLWGRRRRKKCSNHIHIDLQCMDCLGYLCWYSETKLTHPDLECPPGHLNQGMLLGRMESRLDGVSDICSEMTRVGKTWGSSRSTRWHSSDIRDQERLALNITCGMNAGLPKPVFWYQCITSHVWWMQDCVNLCSISLLSWFCFSILFINHYSLRETVWTDAYADTINHSHTHPHPLEGIHCLLQLILSNHGSCQTVTCNKYALSDLV